MAFENAIFFDNLQKHIDEVEHDCIGVYTVKIPHEGDYPVLKPRDHPAFTELLTNIGSNTYIHLLDTLMKSQLKDTYDSLSGIRDTDIATYGTWEARTEGTHRAVVLDWDRTLTQVEGFLLTHDPAVSFADNGIVRYWLNRGLLTEPLPPAVTVEDTLVYLFGGRERLQMLRTWLESIANKGIHIVILTNNRGCNFQVFREMAQALLPTKGTHEFICSGFTTDGNKGQALRNEIQFANLCHIRGGRRNTYRNIFKKRNVTRRRK